MKNKIQVRSLYINNIYPIDDLLIYFTEDERTESEVITNEKGEEEIEIFVLYGANSSGKTTVLNILDGLLDSFLPSSSNSFSSICTNSIFNREDFDGDAILNIELDVYDKIYNFSIFACRSEERFQSKEFKDMLDENYVGYIFSGRKNTISSYRRVTKGDDIIYLEKTDLFENIFLTYYIDSYNNYLLEDNLYFRICRKDYENTVGKINKYLEDMGIHLIVTDEGCKFKNADSDKLLNLSSLSSGERNFIHLLFQLCSCKSEYRIYLIDLPERDLHEHQQVQFMDALKDITKDVNSVTIMASHSWIFIEEVGHEGIRILPDPDKVYVK